jgi:hypothetical protein
MPTKEQLILRRKWVAALKSGDYHQGKGVLKKRITVDGEPNYCCLGVLCEVMGIPNDFDGLVGSFTFADGSISCLSEKTRDAVGLKTAWGTFSDDNPGDSLAHCNDAGLTFVEIADIIENTPSLWQD